jgi:hypothetical protein
MNKDIGRNELCPCGSGKKYKRCCIQKQTSALSKTSAPSFSWMDDEGLHLMAAGTQPSAEQLEKMTEKYQKRIRESPMWGEMVSKFGKEEAERLLKQCRARLG